MNPLLSRTSADPNVCFGKPCVRGTRIRVSLLLDLLAAIAYGAEMSRGRFVDLPGQSAA
jgi:uncharacterized protein (DUF433 family)